MSAPATAGAAAAGLLADADPNIGNLTGLGVGGVLLILVFRTLWKFSADSSELARNYDAALDRAQKDAALARTEAAAANLTATTAIREALAREVELRAEIAELRATVARLEAGRTNPDL